MAFCFLLFSMTTLLQLGVPNVVTIKLFADDTKIYREINHAEDTSAQQSDLVCLENWTRSWQVKFNRQKCEVMRITHKQNKSKHPYYLSNTELKSVNLCKGLGVCVSRDLPGRTTWMYVTARLTRTLIGRVNVPYERIKYGAKVVMHAMRGEFHLYFIIKQIKELWLCSVLL